MREFSQVLVGRRAVGLAHRFGPRRPEHAKSRETTKELARRRDARHGPRGLNSCRPELLLHRQPGLELLRERGHDPPRARRGAGELEPPSAGFSPARVV